MINFRHKFFLFNFNPIFWSSVQYINYIYVQHYHDSLPHLTVLHILVSFVYIIIYKDWDVYNNRFSSSMLHQYQIIYVAYENTYLFLPIKNKMSKSKLHSLRYLIKFIIIFNLKYKWTASIFFTYIYLLFILFNFYLLCCIRIACVSVASIN